MPLTGLGTYMRADIKIILNENQEALKKIPRWYFIEK